MNKTARQQIANHFYNLGIQAAMLKTAAPASEVLKRTLRAAAPYIGIGGGAALGKNMAQAAVTDVQKAISRAHLPNIQKTFNDAIKIDPHYGDPMYRIKDINRLLNEAKRATIPGINPNSHKIEQALENIGDTKVLMDADKSNVMEAMTKSINQQELAEMGLLGAGLVGGGVLGHKVLKDLLRKRIIR